MFWFHPDLERLENEIKTLEYKPKLVFYGSSTFTSWSEVTTIFKQYNPINLGFGGSSLAACTWFFERIFENIKELDAIIIYAGDNDLGNGRHPEELILHLENLLSKISKKYGNIKCTFISIKPSPSRVHLLNSIHYTNHKIKKLLSTNTNFYFINIFDDLLDKNGNPNSMYFQEDGLHFNALGYQLLENILQKNSEIFPLKTSIKT
ncbi:GDSL-type esterase/lipase family protein [uncultured Polaribacter sp.]|uniref:GDSL-type esterase/lipase family protein n=1 Tax=uncultured Polaribacter sp. TaxID=174711 RepID=UPI0030D85234|tara:strand:+ start:2618 stop:3235 length:618 start_codon:yes stop_codon:yes gene_type:complete